MNKDIILLGIQWCWKWTQADLLIKILPNHKYFEMGEILRSFHSSNNFIWNHLKEVMNHGDMIEHFITYDLIDIAIRISEQQQTLLLIDWFPRAIEQAEFFVKKMELYCRNYVVIEFKLSRERALERMIKRAEIESRKDDTLEVMNRRIDLFEKNTIPVLEFFKQQGNLLTINADDNIDKVADTINSKLWLVKA